MYGQLQYTTAGRVRRYHAPVATVLIVEDDPILQHVMRQHLTAAGFDVFSMDRFGFSPQRGVPPTAHVLGRATRR